MANRPRKLVEDTYLGDGVYASYDGHHIILDLRGQDSTTRIALDPDTLVNLLGFSDRIKTAVTEIRVNSDD